MNERNRRERKAKRRKEIRLKKSTQALNRHFAKYNRGIIALDPNDVLAITSKFSAIESVVWFCELIGKNLWDDFRRQGLDATVQELRSAWVRNLHEGSKEYPWVEFIEQSNTEDFTRYIKDRLKNKCV